MKIKHNYRPASIFVIIVCILTAVLFSGCSKLINQVDRGEGRIVFTLSRASSTNPLLTAFDPAETDPVELPRAVSRVFEQLDGYLIRIKGALYESSSLYIFEPGQDELSVEIKVPAGNYSITMLALAQGGATGEKILLGSGSSDFTVVPGQITSAAVHMYPYKYVIEGPESFAPEAGVTITAHILGPLMAELFAPDEGESRLFFSRTTPEGNFNQGSDYLTPVVNKLTDGEPYSCYRFQAAVPATSDYFSISPDGDTEIYQSYFQLELRLRAEWQEIIEEVGLSQLTLLTPDQTAGDTLEMVTTTPGENPQTPSVGTIYTVTGSISNPEDIITDSSGNLYVAGSQVMKIDTEGNITLIAGSGQVNFNYPRDDRGEAVDTTFWSPCALDRKDDGTLYIVDNGACVLKRVDPDGKIYTVAGIGGTSGYSGDGGLAVNARLNNPCGVAVDDQGRVYIADTGNNRIRMIYTDGDNNRIISTVAGTGIYDYNGDGPALSTHLSQPRGLYLDEVNNYLYIADDGNNRVRKLDIAAGTITTVAGGGADDSVDYEGDPAGILLRFPREVALDSAGNLYISAYNVVRKLENGVIKTAAGTGNSGMGEDGLPATEADISPRGLAVDSSGTIYIVDPVYDVIRKVIY